MRVDLTAEEVLRAIARAAVEKAYSPNTPWKWGEGIEVYGLSGEGGVTAELRDGEERYVALARKPG